MAKIRIVADSSCDFPAEVARELGFSLVYLSVSFGDQHFKGDGDLSQREFFRMMKESPVLPKTSQPSPQDFVDEFWRDTDCTDIVCITVTSGSSGTYNSACLARQMVMEDPSFTPRVHVVDSFNASIAIGLMAKAAAAMAKAGESVEAILARLEEMRMRMSIYFVLDTLEYVRKGGRIGAVKAGIGGFLHIKPLLTFLRGLPKDVGITRSFNQARDALVKKFLERSADHSEVTIIHTDCPEKADSLAAELRKTLEDIRITIFEVGPVMGSYTGPGGIGLAFEEQTNRW